MSPIVTIYRDNELGDILRDCGAPVLFVPATWRSFEHQAMAERLRTELPNLEPVVVVRCERGAATEPAVACETLAETPIDGIGWPRQDPDAVKFAKYASGTTGRAKGVLHTHNTLANSLTVCMEFWQVAWDDFILMPSPVRHMTGYLWGLDAPVELDDILLAPQRAGGRRHRHAPPAAR